MFINLLPANTRIKIQFRSVLRRYALLWGIAGVAVLVYVSVHIRELCHAHHRLAELDARCQPLHALQQETIDNQQQLVHLQAECEMLTQLQPANHLIDLLGILVRATRDEAGKLQLQRLSLQTGQPAVSITSEPRVNVNAPEAAKSATFTSLSLQGVAADDVALTRFVAGLRATGVFARVDLKSSSQIGSSSQTTRQYQLECCYRDQP